MNRFLKAQSNKYEEALQELKEGKKKTHWMWFIFPQIYGLASSATAIKYEFKSIAKAKEYFKNDVLRERLLELSNIVYNLNKDIEDIFGYPDVYKFKSCMTLFYLIDLKHDIFKKNLDRYFSGQLCQHTKLIYEKENK